MIYFVDFDRTLFDTDAFNATLPDEPGCAAFADTLRAEFSAGRDETLTGGAGRVEAWEMVTDALRSGTLSFPPGALARFLYADAAEFLRALGNEAIIITYGNEVRQRAKVESALADIVRVTVLYTEERSKAEFLSEWPGYYGTPAILVDDRRAELEQVAERFPRMELFQMRRDGARRPPLEEEGEERWRIIRSLAELP